MSQYTASAKISLFFSILVFVAGIFFVIDSNILKSITLSRQRSSANIIDNNATLIFVDKDGHEREFSGPVKGSMSILDTLIAVASAGEFDFSYGFDKNNSFNIYTFDNISFSDAESTCGTVCVYYDGSYVEYNFLDQIQVAPNSVILVRAYPL